MRPSRLSTLLMFAGWLGCAAVSTRTNNDDREGVQRALAATERRALDSDFRLACDATPEGRAQFAGFFSGEKLSIQPSAPDHFAPGETSVDLVVIACGTSAHYTTICDASACAVIGGIDLTWAPTGWQMWTLPTLYRFAHVDGVPDFPFPRQAVDAAGASCKVSQQGRRCTAICENLTAEAAGSTGFDPAFDRGCWEITRVASSPTELRELEAVLSGQTRTWPQAFSGASFRRLDITVDEPCSAGLSSRLDLAPQDFYDPTRSGGLAFNGAAILFRQGGVWRREGPLVEQRSLRAYHAEPSLGAAAEERNRVSPHNSYSGLMWFEPSLSMHESRCFSNRCPDEWQMLARRYEDQVADPSHVVPSVLLDWAATELAAGHVARSRAVYRQWLGQRRAHPELKGSYPSDGDFKEVSWEAQYAELESGAMIFDPPCQR